MAKPTIRFVFKENPDGSRTEIDSDDFFGCTSPYTMRWNTADKERFHEERIAIEQGKVRYICGGCQNPVVLRGGRNEEGVSMYFRHRGDAPEDCPFEGDREPLSESQMRALKNNGLQESLLHDKLKCFIADILERQGYTTSIERTLKINAKQSRRPDVLAQKDGRIIVFEIQMSTTFLNVVVGRMNDYNSVNHSVIWVFHKFEPDVYTTKDTYQFQNNNVFILDEEMMDLSLKNNSLAFRVHYLEYDDIGESSPKSEWKDRIVGLDDLVFDSPNGVYYFDSKTSRKQVVEKIEQREEYHRNINEGLCDISALECLDQSKIDALCSSSDEDIDGRIEDAVKEGLYGEITPNNIISLFQWLEILKQRGISSKYEFVKSVIRNEIVYKPEYQERYIWDWDGFNLFNHPTIIEDIQLLFAIYHLGYWPNDDESSFIDKTMRAEYVKTHRDQKANDSFLNSLTHFFLNRIVAESSNIRERKELISLYFQNLSFISCVIAVTMRRFVEHDFSNLIGFCNYVWDHCKPLCKVFLRVIDNAKIAPQSLISKKGTNHYVKIKTASQGQSISPAMDRLLSIIIPKVWNI